MPCWGVILRVVFFPDLFFFCLHWTIVQARFRPENRTALRNAVLDWSGNRTFARVRYGEMNTWDTSWITDMTAVFAFLSINEPVLDWNTSGVRSMHGMFYMNSEFNQPVGAWDTSQVTDMRFMFRGASRFNQPLATWNTSQVTNMGSMFIGAAFNQPLATWDTSQVTNMGSMFRGASFDQPLATWDTSQVTDMGSMFSGAWRFNQPLATWNTSRVTNMGFMFSASVANHPTAIGASRFNQPLATWDTSRVTDMGSMFMGAASFNQPLATWDTSRVTNMQLMFWEASSFNQPLATWDTSRVTNMQSMFWEASRFNQPLATWDTSRVTNMRYMFRRASSFNQPLATWDTSRVTDMESMFSEASSFNQPLATWDTSRVANMQSMFSEASSFNQSLATWNTSRVTNMGKMFRRASSFNQPLGTWDTSRVTDMSHMFWDATAFNQPLATWNTSQVSRMDGMFFAATSFDQPLSAWNTSQVTDMSRMFQDATAFNQPLAIWNTSQVTDMSLMFYRACSFSEGIAGWYLPTQKMTGMFACSAVTIDDTTAWNISCDECFVLNAREHSRGCLCSTSGSSGSSSSSSSSTASTTTTSKNHTNPASSTTLTSTSSASTPANDDTTVFVAAAGVLASAAVGVLASASGTVATASVASGAATTGGASSPSGNEPLGEDGATQQLSEVRSLLGCKAVTRVGGSGRRGAAVIAPAKRLSHALRTLLRFAVEELEEPPNYSGILRLRVAATATIVELFPTAMHMLSCCGGDRFTPSSEVLGFWTGQDGSFVALLSTKHMLLWLPRPGAGLLQLTTKRTKMDKAIGFLVEWLPQLLPLVFGIITNTLSTPVPDVMFVSLIIGAAIALCSRLLRGCLKRRLTATARAWVRQALTCMPGLVRFFNLIVLFFILSTVVATNDSWLMILTGLSIINSFLEMAKACAPATYARTASCLRCTFRGFRCLSYLFIFLVPWFMLLLDAFKVDDPDLGVLVGSVVLSRVGEYLSTTLKQPPEANDKEESNEEDQEDGNAEEKEEEEEEEEDEDLEVRTVDNKRAGSTLSRKDWERYQQDLWLHSRVTENGEFLANYFRRRRLPCSAYLLRTAANQPSPRDTFLFLDRLCDSVRAANDISSPTPAGTTSPAGSRSPGVVIPAGEIVQAVILQERNSGRNPVIALQQANFQTTRCLLQGHMDVIRHGPLWQDAKLRDAVTVARKYELEDAPTYTDQGDDIYDGRSKIQVVVRHVWDDRLDAQSVEEVQQALTIILRDAVGLGGENRRRPELFRADYDPRRCPTPPEGEDEADHPWRPDARAASGILLPDGVAVTDVVLQECNTDRNFEMAAQAGFETTRMVLQRRMADFEAHGSATDPGRMRAAVDEIAEKCILEDFVGRWGLHRRRPVLYRVDYNCVQDRSPSSSQNLVAPQMVGRPVVLQGPPQPPWAPAGQPAHHDEQAQAPAQPEQAQHARARETFSL